MIMRPDVVKTQDRVYHQDGSFYDTVVVRFTPEGLCFRDIDQSDPRVKLCDIAHLRYYKACARGESKAVVVAYLRLAQDLPVGKVLAGLSPVTERGETLLSANSTITYTLRALLSRGWLDYHDDAWRVRVPASEAAWRERGRAVLDLLVSQDRLHLESGRRSLSSVDFAGFSASQNLIPIARCGFLSDLVWHQRPRLAFNSAFFLLEDEDFGSHHAALGEAYDLWVADGAIHRPPLYRRGTLFDDGRWRAGFFGLDDLQIVLPTGLRLWPAGLPLPDGAIPFTLNDEGPSEVTLYTRYCGVAGQGVALGRTPVAPGRFELTVVDRRVVGYQAGGDLELPQNGFAISFAPRVLPAAGRGELLNALRTRFRLDYGFARPEHRAIEQALQAGPVLLRQGRATLSGTYLQEQEQFWPSRSLGDGRWQVGVVPTDYKLDVDRTRAGRAGLGVDRAGNLVLAMVSGVNRGLEVRGVDSEGATLNELVDLLAEAGAVDAINLDGGGSTQAYYEGGQALVPGDRRGRPQVHYERMVPSVGIVF
jgi:hypothetical protein